MEEDSNNEKRIKNETRRRKLKEEMNRYEEPMKDERANNINKAKKKKGEGAIEDNEEQLESQKIE